VPLAGSQESICAFLQKNGRFPAILVFIVPVKLAIQSNWIAVLVDLLAIQSNWIAVLVDLLAIQSNWIWI